MRIYLMTNNEARPRHIQLRLGDIDDPESNPLVFDGVLMPEQGTEIFCHGRFAFGRDRYVGTDEDDKQFSEWSRHESPPPTNEEARRYYGETEIREMIRLFEARTLPESQWTHDAHIITAVWYLFHNDGEEALQKVSQHIVAYKAVTESANGSRAYHETLTRFWLLVVREYLDAYMPPNVEIAANTILTLELSERSLPFRFYSRELLFSPLAVRSWVEPDVKSRDELAKLVRSTIKTV